MPSWGDKAPVRVCGTFHAVRIGEINAHRQIEFVCARCGGRVGMDHDGSKARVNRLEPNLVLKLDFSPSGR